MKMYSHLIDDNEFKKYKLIITNRVNQYKMK